MREWVREVEPDAVKVTVGGTVRESEKEAVSVGVEQEALVVGLSVGVVVREGLWGAEQEPVPETDRVGVCVEVALDVAVPLWDRVRDSVGVRDALRVCVPGDRVGECVAVRVDGDCVGVRVGTVTEAVQELAVTVAVGVPERDPEGVWVRVRLSCTEPVGVGERDDVAVRVQVVRVRLAVPPEGDDVCVRDGVRV